MTVQRRTNRPGTASSTTRCAAARMASRSSTSAKAPQGPRSITSTMPLSPSSTRRWLWRSTPSRWSRPATHDTTPSQRMWCARADHRARHRSPRRPACTIPTNGMPWSTRRTARRALNVALLDGPCAPRSPMTGQAFRFGSCRWAASPARTAPAAITSTSAAAPSGPVRSVISQPTARTPVATAAARK